MFDPRSVKKAARHRFDPQSGRNVGSFLKNIEIKYTREAFFSSFVLKNPSLMLY